MSQCYLGSESKNSMTKFYFEVFIANYFYTFNKKDPVVTMLEKNKNQKIFYFAWEKNQRTVIDITWAYWFRSISRFLCRTEWQTPYTQLSHKFIQIIFSSILPVFEAVINPCWYVSMSSNIVIVFSYFLYSFFLRCTNKIINLIWCNLILPSCLSMQRALLCKKRSSEEANRWGRRSQETRVPNPK